jgi:chromosome segregation ATPase
LSENNSNSFKPNTEEKVAELQEKLSAADSLINRKNQELQVMGGVLAEANQKISERDEEIERLKSQLDNRLGEISTSSAPIAIELPEAADLLNELKRRRRKSRAELADMETVREILRPDTD